MSRWKPSLKKDSCSRPVSSSSPQCTARVGSVRYLLVHVQFAEDLGRIQKVRVVHNLLDVPAQQRKVEDQWQPVSVDEEHECQESMHGSLGDNVRVQAVAEVNGVDVVAVVDVASASCRPKVGTDQAGVAYHSKSLYMIVKKTCRNKLTAFISTANRKSHASPDILSVFFCVCPLLGFLLGNGRGCCAAIARLGKSGFNRRRYPTVVLLWTRWSGSKRAPEQRKVLWGRGQQGVKWMAPRLDRGLLCVAVAGGTCRVVVEGACLGAVWTGKDVCECGRGEDDESGC